MERPYAVLGFGAMIPDAAAMKCFGDALSSTSAFNLRQSEALSATTRAFIVKSFRVGYLAISEANRTLALVMRNIKTNLLSTLFPPHCCLLAAGWENSRPGPFWCRERGL